VNRSVVLTGLGLTVLVLASPRPAFGQVRHERLHIALHEMREARGELRTAAHNFGGHREKALEAVNASIRQIEEALRAVGDNVKGIAPAGEVYKRYKHHPHIHYAIEATREARAFMLAAKHDFKGHREAAIRDMDVALDQLQLCLKFARR